MAGLFKPIKRTLAELGSIAKQEGQFLVATDTGEAFVDVSNSERLKLLGSGVNGINLLSLTASQFNSATFTSDTYVHITDGGTLALNSTFFAGIMPGSIVNVLASGQVLISNAIAPADSYEALSDGYRELSVIIDNSGKAIITVYEKTLYEYLSLSERIDLPIIDLS